MAERPSDKLLATFAHRLKELRDEAGWSQSDLATRSGLHRTYIAGMETERRNPSLAALEQLAAAFAMTPSELLEGVVGRRRPHKKSR